MSNENVADDAPHILVIDDDNRIRSLLQRYLSDQGLRVSGAADATTARRFMGTLAFDLLIVDIMMPGEDGLSLTSSIRDKSDIPILMLTAKSDTDDRISGLETGADDYLSKPFEPRELLLRVNNILKRYGPPPGAAIELVCFGPFTFNLGKGELKRNDDIIRLTDREKEMMRIFCQNPGETVPRHELLSDPDGAGERTVDVQINRLRRKIEIDPANPIYLHTVRGIGYRIMTD
ncbi:MAG: response regulator [Pseudomonadota bacterium]